MCRQKAESAAQDGVWQLMGGEVAYSSMQTVLQGYRKSVEAYIGRKVSQVQVEDSSSGWEAVITYLFWTGLHCSRS